MPVPKTIEFAAVGRGPFAWKPRPSGYGPQCLLIRSREGWSKLAGSFSFEPVEPPVDQNQRLLEVDYGRQSILVVTLGEAGSAGSNLAIERIEAGPPAVVVISTTHPAEGDLTAAMMTHPFFVAIVNTASLAAATVFMMDGRKVEFERHVFE